MTRKERDCLTRVKNSIESTCPNYIVMFEGFKIPRDDLSKDGMLRLEVFNVPEEELEGIYLFFEWLNVHVIWSVGLSV